ncbi:MAG: FlgD immunoglobulin-like domain containing protein, partial [bacterium]
WCGNEKQEANMKISSALFMIVCILLFYSMTMAQSIKVATNPKEQVRYTEHVKKIRRALQKDFAGSPVRPDYPIQDYYHLPFKNSERIFQTALNDTTPPTDPSNLIVTKESIHSIFVSWTASSDPESGIDYYAFGIGTQPGMADLQWWWSVGTNTSSYPASLAELGIPEGTIFYFSVRAANGAGLNSNIVSTGPVSAVWEDLGNPNNELTVAFADYGFDSTGTNIISGWNSAEIELLDHFISRMNPIIKEIYGPPSHAYTVTLVKNLWYSGSNIFFPSSNQVHMSDFYPQLLTHELIHAYRDNVILSTDDFWHYHPQLSGFEEGFAQGVSYVCMNRYIELYPNDTIVDSTYLFGSSMDWDYDFRNVRAITTEDFWSDYGGMGLFWERYELAAAAMRKIHLEDPSFFRNFNSEYYSRLNNDHLLTTSRDLLIDIIEAVLPEIEMQPSAEWIAAQRVFDCKIVPGRKIWLRTQHYPWSEFLIFQRILYYETFENGSDWAYWDETAGEWGYYNLNGSTGMATVSTHSDSIVWQGNLLIEPTENPPLWYGFGSDELNFSTDNDLLPWPGGDPSDYVLGMLDLNLYRFDLNFDGTQLQTFRVIGKELCSTTGIFGGIRNATDGVIYIDHENFPPEPPLQVMNGAFWGTRQWASVPNPKTGGTDSQPGRISIRFVQDDGRQYLAQRNIDWGSWNGNQAFLFNTEEMLLDSSMVSTITDNNVPNEFMVQQNYPNPFNPTTEIHYTLPQTGTVKILIYNTLGQKVKTLVNKRQEAGTHNIVWDGTNDDNLNVVSGIYYYMVMAGKHRVIKKMILLH